MTFRMTRPGIVPATVLAIALAGIAATVYGQTATPAAQPRGYLIANYDIDDPVAYRAYTTVAGPISAKFGGRLVVSNRQATAVEGRPPAAIVIVEFPSLAAAQRFYDSPEYVEARKLRIAATTGSVILTEGATPRR